VIKRSTLRRPTVELDPAVRPSRIRRDPPPAEGTNRKALNAYPTEREVWTVVIGVVVFALAITVAIVGSSNNLFN
jgi:hypothetical protein